MPILDYQNLYVGAVGITPSISYMLTDDTVPQILADGYLNKLVSSGAIITETTMVLVVTKSTPNGKVDQIGWFDVDYELSTKTWSLAQANNGVLAAQSANVGGAGATVEIAIPGVTVNSVATASIVSSSNAVSIQKVTPGVNKITIVFSGDPGANAIVSYLISFTPIV